MKSILLTLTILSSLLACSDHKSAGGFGSETTNGVTLAGHTEPGTVIRAYKANNTTASASANRTIADDDGYWELNLPAGGYLVESRTASQAAARNVVLRSEDTIVAIDLDLAPITTLVGQVPTSALTRQSATAQSTLRAVLYGTGRTAPVDASGRFEFDSIPQGHFVVRLESNGTATGEALLSTESIDTLTAEISPLVLEDFDDGNSSTNLSALFGSSFWLAWLAADQGTLTTPSTSNDYDISPLLTDSTAYQGKSLHIKVDVDETSPATASLLLVLGSRGAYGEVENLHDLSKSDSLVFYAKGQGSAWVNIWANLKNDTERHHLRKEFSLQENWTRTAIAWSDLIAAGDSVAIGADWLKYEVLKVTFDIEADTDFWLDQIEVQGMSIIDILNP